MTYTYIISFYYSLVSIIISSENYIENSIKVPMNIRRLKVVI